MRFWLVTIGEPLPVKLGTRDRLHRAGQLAHLLAEHGHQIVWWSSTFDHMRKQHHFPDDRVIRLNDHLDLRLLHGRGYKRNVSVGRIRDHRKVAAKFARQAQDVRPRPDLILVSLPTLELSVEAVRFGATHRVPVVVDVRDLWPDTIIEQFPPFLRRAALLMTLPLSRLADEACSNATALTGATDDFVRWGLDRAGRDRRSSDRSFPMGYRRPDLSKAKLDKARSFWHRQGIGGQGEGFIATFFGTIGRMFHLTPLIECARILRDRGIKARFVICGDGDNLEQYREQASTVPTVLFPGWVEAAEIQALLDVSDLGLAPYIDSPNFTMNLPNKPPEYMSKGVPVATSLNHGLLRDLLEQEGCGFSYANDPEVLADRIEQLINEPELLNEMSSASLRVFEERFVAEKVYGQMMTYLQAIASGQGAE